MWGVLGRGGEGLKGEMRGARPSRSHDFVEVGAGRLPQELPHRRRLSKSCGFAASCGGDASATQTFMGVRGS